MYRDPDSDLPPLLIVAFMTRVMALDRKTGELRWEAGVSTLAAGVELAVVGDRVYAVTPSGMLHVIDYRDGTELTQQKLPGSYTGRATMVLDGAHLFVASGGEVTCLDLEGNVVWFNGLKGKGVAVAALGFPSNVRQADTGR